MTALRLFLFAVIASLVNHLESASSFNFPKDDVFTHPVNFMSPQKTAHSKYDNEEGDILKKQPINNFQPYDFSKFDSYLEEFKNIENYKEPEHNRLKRKAKRKRARGGRHRSKGRTALRDDSENKSANHTTTEVPISRTRLKKPKPNYERYNPLLRESDANFIEMPKDLYQAHLRPGVIFRIHMSEAILKMQYRNYGEDKDESVIEADVEYLRLTRKVISDEITKFEDLKWLMSWFNNRSELIQEHICNTRYYAVGIPPTMYTHSEEYMKRACLFDNVYLDHIPYVIGEDSSLMAAVAPPVLHCDAATCTSVPFIDSVMFEERYPRTNVRTVTRCQASCRAHCRNDPDCLKRCTDRCFRSDTD